MSSTSAWGRLSNAEERYFKGGNFLWKDQVKHDTYDDYWKARNLAPHMHNVTCAVMTVGGWFDAEDLAGPFKTYRSIEEKNPGIENTLVIGPWVHGGWARGDGDRLGSVEFAAKTGEFFRDQIQFPFFERELKGKGKEKLPEAYVFETGTNVWRRYRRVAAEEVRDEDALFSTPEGSCRSTLRRRAARPSTSM